MRTDHVMQFGALNMVVFGLGAVGVSSSRFFVFSVVFATPWVPKNKAGPKLNIPSSAKPRDP